MTDLTTMTALPPYLRVAESLSLDIRAGRLRKGDRLPPERALAAEHGIAVATLRKALGLLAERGLIERRHGSGNYVTGAQDRSGTYALFRLERHPQGGGLPSAELIALDRAAPPADLPPLATGPSPAWHLRRLRRLDGTPVAVEDIWLAPLFETALTPEMLSESLYKTYRDRLDLQIVHVEDRLRVAPRPDWAPPDLDVAAGTQMGLVERQAFDGYGRVAEVSLTWFDPARARYFTRHP